MTDIEQRFLSHVQKTDNCWLWSGARHRDGYGWFAIRTNCPALAHRVAATLWLEFKLSSGLQVLHRCDNPPCVNPDHLFVGTNADNVQDKMNKGRHVAVPRRTHCINGHELNERTIYVRSRGKRQCKVCHALREKARRDKRKSKIEN